VAPALRVLTGPGEAQLTVRRSRFCAHSAPVADDGAALRAFVEEVRRSHRDAGHVVYAWRGESARTRSSDDGEPHGTGGRPCLVALEQADVVGSAVAVARVFGGTLLGSAGLARAYGDAARAAVGAAPSRALARRQRARVRAAFADQAVVEAALAGAVDALTRTYTAAGVELEGEIEADRFEALARAVAGASGGRARLTAVEAPRWR
jgi:putative IMPACT (imprinted ancient) family translation regulator